VPEDAGYGPPPGNPSGPGRDNGGVPFDQLARQYMGGLETDTKDPAWTRLTVDATDENTRARVKLIYRDIPLVTIQNTWSIEAARGALYAHLIGQFYTSGMLCDSILGDDRVTATLNSRASAIFGRETRFKPANSSSQAKECCDAWEAWWPRLFGDSAIRELQDYSTMMGFSHAQILSIKDNGLGLEYAPTLLPWHPVFTWYDWMPRCFQAIGSDAMIPIIPGNGKWVEHAPYGSYRGWIRGALRAVVEPWMLRHFGFRDMARFGEVHGNPTRIGYVPMVGDATERENFQAALAKLGADAAMLIPRGIDPTDGLGYDYKLVEATSKAWEVHPAQIDRCDMAIVLALLMVNLTTQVEGGSYGAARAQMDVRSEGSQLDNQSWKRTIYQQIARPFAYLNFGDANLAPWTWWDVVARDEYKNNAQQFKEFGNGLMSMAKAGIKFASADEVRKYATERFGLAGLPAFTIGDPPAGSGGGGEGGGGFGQ
jgi:phage gp29-like protein